jgi:hypothetical protein
MHRGMPLVTKNIGGVPHQQAISITFSLIF